MGSMYALILLWSSGSALVTGDAGGGCRLYTMAGHGFSLAWTGLSYYRYI